MKDKLQHNDNYIEKEDKMMAKFLVIYVVCFPNLLICRSSTLSQWNITVPMDDVWGSSTEADLQPFSQRPQPTGRTQLAPSDGLVQHRSRIKAPNPKDRFKIFLNTVPTDQQPICRFHVVLSCCIMFCGSKFPMVFLHYDKCPTCTVATTQQDPTPNLQPLPERWKTFFDSRMSTVPLVRWTAGNFNGSNRLSWRSIYLWLMTFYKV